MPQYGSTMTFIVILLSLFVTGILYMTLDPIMTIFLEMGATAGADPYVMDVMDNVFHRWLPIVIFMALIMYGWRKSRNRVDM
jgi:hypothetical protein